MERQAVQLTASRAAGSLAEEQQQVRHLLFPWVLTVLSVGKTTRSFDGRALFFFKSDTAIVLVRSYKAYASSLLAKCSGPTAIFRPFYFSHGLLQCFQWEKSHSALMAGPRFFSNLMLSLS